MSGFQPPIPVRQILAMDVVTKNRTADLYCRENKIADPARRYEGHTRWLNWNELDSFYWDPERGVAAVSMSSLSVDGQSTCPSNQIGQMNRVDSISPLQRPPPKVCGVCLHTSNVYCFKLTKLDAGPACHRRR